MSLSYRPSSGSEGVWFEQTFCDKCIEMSRLGGKKKECLIFLKMMLFSINHPDYPTELIIKNNNPLCTNFKIKSKKKEKKKK